MLWHFFRAGFGQQANALLDEFLSTFFRKRLWLQRYHEILALLIGELRSCGERCGVESWMGDNFQPEAALAKEELRLYYSLPQQTEDPETVKNVQEFLFEGIPRPGRTSEKLAVYAVARRQGLRPERGLVEIS